MTDNSDSGTRTGTEPEIRNIKISYGESEVIEDTKNKTKNTHIIDFGETMNRVITQNQSGNMGDIGIYDALLQYLLNRILKKCMIPPYNDSVEAVKVNTNIYVGNIIYNFSGPENDKLIEFTLEFLDIYTSNLSLLIVHFVY
jgi:hypothetical protein